MKKIASKKAIVPKIVAWCGLAVIIFVTVSPIGLRPPDLLPVNVDRALAFSLLSCLFVLAYPRQWKLGIFAAVVGPSAIELLQLLSPSRHAHLDDAMVKSLGGLMGVPIGLAVNTCVAMIKSYRRQAARQFALRKFSVSPSLKELPVKSRIISSVYFSQEDGQLRISLSNGEQRLFAGVTEDDAIAMVEAPSPGNYYLNEFKHRHKRAA